LAIRKIRFRQSGGFAGLVRGCDVEANVLDVADRAALERHARSGPTTGAPSEARDQIVYEIDMETDAGVRRLEFDEASVPKDLAPVVKALAERSKPMPP
jgi:Emfourin